MTVEELLLWCEKMRVAGKGDYRVSIRDEKEIVVYDDLKYIALNKEDMM